MFGWLSKVFGGSGDSAPGTRFREGLLPEEGVQIGKAYLEAVAARAGLTDVVVVANLAEHEAELRGQRSGLPLRVIVDFTGDVRECEFKYETDDDCEFIDLEFDPEHSSATSPQLKPWDESEKKVYVAPQVFLEGSGADDEHAAFKRLPATLQQRILAAMVQHRIRYFRSRPSEHDNTLWDGAADVREPIEWLAEVIQLSAEVALARGAVAPGSKPRPKPVNAFAEAQADALGEEAEWLAGKAFATELAAKLPGARVVERKSDEAWDVRWAEGGVQLRVVVDVRFGDLEAHARADGVECEFSLHHDTEAAPVSASPSDDGWDEADCMLFIDRATFLIGSRAEVLREAAALRALPPTLLQELLACCRQINNAPDLERSNLHVDVVELATVTDGGDAAVAVARLLGRVVSALPKGPLPPVFGEVKCSACGACWLPSVSSSCAHCGTVRY